MPAPRKHALLAAVGAAILALSLTATAAPAATAARPQAAIEDGAGHSMDRQRQILEISSSKNGLHAPTAARPGPATFRVSTTDPDSGWVSLVRPKPGVTWEEFRDTLLLMIDHYGPDIIEGSARLQRQAELSSSGSPRTQVNRT